MECGHRPQALLGAMAAHYSSWGPVLPLVDFCFEVPAAFGFDGWGDVPLDLRLAAVLEVGASVRFATGAGVVLDVSSAFLLPFVDAAGLRFFAAPGAALGFGLKLRAVSNSFFASSFFPKVSSTEAR